MSKCLIRVVTKRKISSVEFELLQRWTFLAVTKKLSIFLFATSLFGNQFFQEESPCVVLQPYGALGEFPKSQKMSVEYNLRILKNFVAISHFVINNMDFVFFQCNPYLKKRTFCDLTWCDGHVWPHLMWRPCVTSPDVTAMCDLTWWI